MERTTAGVDDTTFVEVSVVLDCVGVGVGVWGWVGVGVEVAGVNVVSKRSDTQ